MSTNPKINQTFQDKFLGILLAAFYLLALTGFCISFDYSLEIPLIPLFLGVHLFFMGKRDHKLYWSLGVLLTLVVFMTHILIQYTVISPLYIPLAGVVILTMLLLKETQLAFLMSIACSLIHGLMIDTNIGMMFILFVGALMSAYLVRDARTREQLYFAGLLASLIHLSGLVLLNPSIFMHLTKAYTYAYIIPLAANGIVSMALVAFTLKIFESLFGVLTNYRLLELADFNHPLLRQMILDAPGTYHHSLVVSNLAEAAADAIGADSLLTRVGAYYHDIGKMARSEYFTENQMVGGNVHDNIEPSMSRLVILNHVKEGIDLAKKYNLNQAIIDFIPQHHGTSLMYYFYQRAVEEAQEDETVKEEDFRYPGPKPQTRETAITLLADSAEGATRSLDEPTPQNIEETVKKVINNKFIDGQLDECPLTLKEIDKISSTFTRILTAMYHSRVKYPEKKNGKVRNGHSHKQSSEKTEDRSGPHKKNSHDGSSL